MIGMMYLANPENVNIEVNGRVLEGAEAVAAAEKAGSFMSTTGGILLIIAVVTLITAIVLAVLYGKKRAQ